MVAGRMRDVIRDHHIIGAGRGKKDGTGGRRSAFKLKAKGQLERRGVGGAVCRLRGFVMRIFPCRAANSSAVSSCMVRAHVLAPALSSSLRQSALPFRAALFTGVGPYPY